MEVIRKNALDETIEPKISDSVDSAKECISVCDGVIFADTPEGVLRADLIWDDFRREPKPAIIWLHNGGFTDAAVTRKTRPDSAFLKLAKKGYLFTALYFPLILFPFWKLIGFLN